MSIGLDSTRQHLERAPQASQTTERGRRLLLWLPTIVAVSVALVWLSANSTPSVAQPVLGFACDSNSDCTGVDEACVFDRCVQVRCNSDSDCTIRLPLCLSGLCQGFPTCQNDSDCGASGGCISGSCRGVECREAADCSAGRPCLDHKCAECGSDSHCGANGACRNNRCVCVACTRDGQCALDQACRQNTCVPFCEPGQVMIPANDGARTCRTCVNPETARRCAQFPGCGQNSSCVQGFCINKCRLEPPDFDRLLDDFAELELQPDPDGLPFCPRCTAIFTLVGLRTALERHGIDQSVTVRLLDRAARPVAELGTFKSKKGAWDSVPVRVQPKLLEAAPALEGCGYLIEVRSVTDASKTVRGEVCLRVRKGN